MRIEPIPYEELDPELRERYEAGVATGMYSMTVPLQIFAYAKAQAIAGDEMYKHTFKQGLLGPRLEELIRISSAQFNGCGPCSSSRKDGSIGDDDVACMLTNLDDPTYTERERRALRFVQLMCTDHHAIDDDMLQSLAEVFSADEPVLRYDPAQVNTRFDDIAIGASSRQGPAS